MKIKYSMKQVKENVGSADAFLGVFLFRWIIVRFTWFFANFTSLTATQLSFLGMFIGIGAGVAFLYQHFILGAILYEVRYFFDCFDGQVARLRKQTSKYGAFMDNYSGFVSRAVAVPLLCIGLYYNTGWIWWLIIAPFMYIIVSFHSMESLTVLRVMGSESFSKNVKGISQIKKFSFLQKFREFLKKHGSAEPLGQGDLIQFMLVFGPIFGLTLYAFLFSALIFIGREVLYFIFYSYTLINADKTQD